MGTNCINHQFINAHWHCKKCNNSFCFECIENKHFKFSKNETFVHICPDCKRRVEWIGIKHIFNSPAKLIVEAIKYPFAKYSLFVILATSIISLFFTKILLIDEILFLAIWIILLSYSTNVTESILRGKKEPPKFTSIPVPVLMNHIFLIFKQALVYLVICTIFYLSKTTMNNTLFSFALILVLAIPLPFIIVRIITANTMKKLFEIAPFISVVKKTKIYYLCACAGFIPVIFMFHLLDQYSAILIIPVLSYLMISIHKLLGQIILQSSKELKYSVDYENFKDMYTLETLHGFKT